MVRGEKSLSARRDSSRQSSRGLTAAGLGAPPGLITALALLLIVFGTGVAQRAAAMGPDQTNVLHFSRTSRATTPDDVVLSFLETEFTLEAWVFLTEAEVANREGSVIWWGGGSDDTISLGVHDGLLWLGFYDGVSGAAVGGPEVPVRSWTHIAATLHENDLRIYMNGLFEAEWLDAVNFVNGWPIPLNVGSEGLTAGLAQVRVWSRALSASELAAGMATPPATDAAGLELWWPLDEGSGQVLTDITANQVALALGGQPEPTEWDPYWTTKSEIAGGPYFHRSQQAVPQPLSWDLLDAPFDYDGDGDSDFFDFGGLAPQHMDPMPPFYANPVNPVVLWRNDNGTFVDATASVLGPTPIQMLHPRHWRIADLTGDGRLDIFVADHGPDGNIPNPDPFWTSGPGGLDRIFVRLPGGGLAEESAARLPGDRAFTHDVVLGDIDGDTDVDIFLANISSGASNGDCCEAAGAVCTTTVGDLAGRSCPLFLINDGSGNFSADHGRIPLDIANTERANIFGSHLLDVDQDNDLDLFLSPLTGSLDRDILLLNDGSGNFSDAAPDALPPWDEPLGGPTEICSGDFDGINGDDLFLSVPSTNRLRLLLNEGNGTYRDASENLPVQESDIAFDPTYIPWTIFCSVVDINRDGKLDIMTTGASEKSWILINRGDALFRLATPTITEFAGGWPANVDSDDRPDILRFVARFGQTVLESHSNLADFPVLLSLDGFETGDTSAWTSSGGAFGSITVNSAASQEGNLGLEVTAGPGCSIEDLVVPDGTVDTDQVACNTVTAGAVEVVSPGAVFRAGSAIILDHGFSVGPGAEFRAEIEPGIATGIAYVEDHGPQSESTYKASFSLRLDNLVMDGSSELQHLAGFSADGGEVFRLLLRRDVGLGQNRLALEARVDGGGFVRHGPEFVLPAGSNRIEVVWGAGAGTGLLQASVNDSPLSGLTLLANDSSRVEFVRWGITGGTLGSVSGALHLDDFRSWR